MDLFYRFIAKKLKFESLGCKANVFTQKVEIVVHNTKPNRLFDQK